MTSQEIFTKVVTHLRQQGQTAMEGVRCRYRTGDGLKCAAGCLIADEDYNPAFEGRDVYGVYEALVRAGVTDGDFSLVNELQTLHDLRDVSLWEAGFERLAKQYSLEVPK